MLDIDVTCVRLYESNLSSISMLHVSDCTSRIYVRYRCYMCQTIRVEFKVDIDVACVRLY